MGFAPVIGVSLVLTAGWLMALPCAQTTARDTVSATHRWHRPSAFARRRTGVARPVTLSNRNARQP